jgi:hypothetical protein
MSAYLRNISGFAFVVAVFVVAMVFAPWDSSKVAGGDILSDRALESIRGTNPNTVLYGGMDCSQGNVSGPPPADYSYYGCLQAYTTCAACPDENVYNSSAPGTGSPNVKPNKLGVNCAGSPRKIGECMEGQVSGTYFCDMGNAYNAGSCSGALFPAVLQ